MKKPRKTSTQSVRVVSSPRPRYDDPYGSPETLDHMKKCEAREWIARYKRKTGEVGAVAARSWWEQMKEGIAKVRGEESLRSLVKLMEQERANSRA